MLKDTVRYTAITIKAKETLVYKSAFLKSLTNLAELLVIFYGMVHLKIIKYRISEILMTQIAMKTLRSDKINFCILLIILG